MTHDATSKPSMKQLASEVAHVPEVDRPAIAAGVMALGLMRCQPWMHFAVWMGRKLRGGSKYDRWLMILKRYPEVARDCLMGLERHIVFDKDTFEKSSVGGLCQREADQLVQLLGCIQPSAPLRAGKQEEE